VLCVKEELRSAYTVFVATKSVEEEDGLVEEVLRSVDRVVLVGS